MADSRVVDALVEIVVVVAVAPELELLVSNLNLVEQADQPTILGLSLSSTFLSHPLQVPPRVFV